MLRRGSIRNTEIRKEEAMKEKTMTLCKCLHVMSTTPSAENDVALTTSSHGTVLDDRDRDGAVARVVED